MIYRRALHPELFDLRGRQTHRHGPYEVECWVAPLAHCVRFQVGAGMLSEVVIEDANHLPELGLAYALPCLGEKDFELEPTNGLGYVTTIQTEVLSDNLYLATCRELRDFSKENQALTHEWTDEAGAPCLSMLDVQKYKKEFHLQSYHLAGSNGLVLRTQSIFEIR